MKKVVIYARSSQDKHDVSCDAQVEQLTRIVRENGKSLYAFSRIRLFPRPGTFGRPLMK